MNYFVQLTVCTLLSAYASDSFAQKAKSRAPNALDFKEAVVIDGNLSEWDDSLHFLYDKQQLQFEVANDRERLYIAMRVVELPVQMQALRQGFNFIINRTGKKKEDACVTFPVPDRESLRALMSDDNEQRSKDVRIALLKAVRAIYVKGLVDVVDGPVSLNNDYGIQAAVAIDHSNAVCYEASIPLERLGISFDEAKVLAFNMKINGVIMRIVGGGRSTSPYGYSAGGYYGNQSHRKEAQQEPGLWFLLPLAKP